MLLRRVEKLRAQDGHGVSVFCVTSFLRGRLLASEPRSLRGIEGRLVVIEVLKLARMEILNLGRARLERVLALLTYS